MCFAAAQCSLQDMLDQGATGIKEIGSGMGHIGGMFIPGLSGLLNNKPGGAGAAEMAPVSGGIRGDANAEMRPRIPVLEFMPEGGPLGMVSYSEPAREY